MRRSRILVLAVTFLALICVGNALASTSVRVLIVDPVNSESGEFCQSVLASLPNGSVVKKVDFTNLAPAAGQKWDVIIAVQPNPANYYPEAAEALKSLLDGHKGGLMVFGLHCKREGIKDFAELLGSRSPAEAKIYFQNDFDKSYWVWSPGESKPKSTVYFRKEFDIDQLPDIAQFQITTDDSEKIWLNGQLLGSKYGWNAFTAYNVADKLRRGKNVISIEAFNGAGFAGMVFSLDGYLKDGNYCLSVKSDKNCRYNTALQQGWQAIDFDDSGWDLAREITTFGGGPWLTVPQRDYRINEQIIQLGNRAHPTTAGVSEELGTTAVLYGLVPNGGAEVLLNVRGIPVAVAGQSPAGRTIMVSASPERCSIIEGRRDLLSSEDFGRFILQSVLWLAEAKDVKAGKVTLPPGEAGQEFGIAKHSDTEAIFPVTLQFTPLPNKGLREVVGYPRSKAGLRRMVDKIINHGVTSLMLPPGYMSTLSDEVRQYVLNYAQSRGMLITYHGHGAELFERDIISGECVYGPDYQAKVRKKVQSILASFKDAKRLYNAFVYMDEPFYGSGEKAFSYNDLVKAEFAKRYGYELPSDLASIRDNPRKWLDVLNFRADYFPDGWRQVYKIIKQIRPDFNVIMTHDSHNTFGGGVGQEEVLAINDVFHWGADFADTLVYDIYPYMMWDFRYGQNKKLPLPRMAQTHYSMRQLHNLTSSYGKRFGFWFGTYNSTWFELTEELRKYYWASNEMVYTAVAHGADWVISGYGIPEDFKHWDNLGAGLRTIKKATGLEKAPRIKAKAAFIFPRTQYLQLQEEYWNVAQSFELFLRAFGELDIIHEEQITDDTLNGYEILTMFDVKLLPEDVAGHIESFVRKGGTVIADCVPNMGKYKEPLDTMEKLFGVTDSQTGRITPGGSATQTSAVKGKALGEHFTMPLVSMRGCEVVDGKVLLTSATGDPVLVKNKVGDGQAYLLGFCVQDSYFDTWKTQNTQARGMLRKLIKAVTDDADVTSHVHSFNPEIEAAIRANDKEGFLFAINHEAQYPLTIIRLSDLPFTVKRIVDVANDREIPFENDQDIIQLELSVPIDAPYLLRLLP